MNWDSSPRNPGALCGNHVNDIRPKPSANSTIRALSPVQLGGFAGTAIIGFLIEAGTLTLLTTGLGMGVYVARVPAFLVKVSLTWLINRHGAFARRRSQNWILEFLRYTGSQATGALSNFVVYAIALWSWPSLKAVPAAALGIGAIVGFCVNYTLAHFFVFKKHHE